MRPNFLYTALNALAPLSALAAPAQQPLSDTCGNLLDVSTNSPHCQAQYVQATRFNTSSIEETMEILKYAQAAGADVWSATPDHVDIHFASSQLPSQLSSFPQTSFSVEIPPPTPSPLRPPSPHRTPWDLEHLDSGFHSSYHRFEDIVEFIDELARTFPRLVELVRVGQTAEGREILGIKIEEPGNRKIRPRVVIQGAQHARDWIAISAALYFAHSLVVLPSEKGSHTTLLEDLAFTIIPVPNPDGYAYTWDHDRLWYKNRLYEPNAQCTGIDMNRNWGFQWEESGDPCHHWYGGARPFEAPEVDALAAYIERTPNIKMFIDLRSYGQMLMYPFSYSCDALPAHAEDLIEAALGAAKANKAVHGMTVATGSACELLYPAPGNVIDWAYAEAGIPFSYSVSLRDTGTYGFLLPATYIRPVGEENSALLHSLSRWFAKVKFSPLHAGSF
ncbi:hypothetical protein DL93DRAFT_2111686 [Clavulina sp. PMI_390]|nr:hypothetical protein DL93DRAFT_2111686 [Clavulina sp. PMI_390]